jgi:SIR2-like domain
VAISGLDEQPAATISTSLWSEEFQTVVNGGRLVPFVSNYLLPRTCGGGAADLATAFAKRVRSPLSDEDNRILARVGQYHSAVVGPRDAHVEYLNAIKEYVLRQAGGDPEVDRAYVERLSQSPDRRRGLTFSEIASNLGYPRFDDPARNPLRLLAELPLPIYVTTCQHQFLEIALTQTGFKTPKVEVFSWNGSRAPAESENENDLDYRPSVERPLVYHLFGLDDSPESIVLSEDDYMSVLIRLSALKHTVKTTQFEPAISDASGDIPSDLKLALSGSGLLLLGYDIDAWEFRVLHRWLVDYAAESRKGRLAPKAFCLQLQPASGPGMEDRNRKIEAYVTSFLAPEFNVYWGTPENCVFELWSRWKQTES